MKRVEIEGLTDRGKVEFQIPANLTRPDILKVPEFTAKHGYFGPQTFLEKKYLVEAVKKHFGDKIPPQGWEGWEKHAMDGFEWNCLAISGRDVPRKTGLRKWLIYLLLPPGVGFFEGSDPIATLKKEPSTYRIFGAITPIPIRASNTKTKDAYLTERDREKGSPLTRQERKIHTHDWKYKHGTKPYRIWFVFGPNVTSQTQLNALNRISMGMAAAMSITEDAREAIGKVPGLESAVTAMRRGNIALSAELGRTQFLLADSRTRNEGLTTELELRSRVPISLQPPQPPDLIQEGLRQGPASSKPPSRPGEYNWAIFLILVFVGLFTLGFGGGTAAPTVGGILLVLVGALLWYWDANYRPKKEQMKQLGIASGKIGKDLLEQAKEKATGT